MTTPMTDERLAELESIDHEWSAVPRNVYRELIAEIKRLRSELDSALQAIENMNDDSWPDNDAE